MGIAQTVTWQDDLAIIEWTETLADPTAGPGEIPFSIITKPYIGWLTDTSTTIGWEVIAEKTILDTLPYMSR